MCLCLISSSFQTLGDGPSNCPLFCALFSFFCNFQQVFVHTAYILPRFSHDFTTARRRANNYLLTSNCAIVRRFFCFFYRSLLLHSIIRNPTKWDFIHSRRISSCTARFHLSQDKFRCAYSRLSNINTTFMSTIYNRQSASDLFAFITNKVRP